MLANRISYWLGVTGPSYAIDTACSSSLYALEHAFRAIRDGLCDSAIVGASNLCLHPCLMMEFSRAGVVSHSGVSRSSDNTADGYVRSEGIAVVYLQKAKNSRRANSQLVYAKTNSDVYKEHGIMHPGKKMQVQLFKESYEECSVDPGELEYIEAHMTATKAGDPSELMSIDEVFCSGRAGPLRVGSVRSNMGHAESAAGLCSLAKMCIAYTTGFIPPNINHSIPNENAPSLLEKRLEVVTEKTPWNRVNSFGFC